MPDLPSVIVGVLSTFVTLSALEVGARYLSDPTDGNADVIALTSEARSSSVLIKAPDPELLYVTRPNYKKGDIRISEAHGILRSDDVEMAKAPGTFRLAVLGDSIAAGHPFRTGPVHAFPMQMETKLAARGGSPRVQVLTFAADGYSTRQEARLLTTQVAPFSPDLVLVAYCVNDPSDSYTPAVWFIDRPGPTFYLADLVRRRLGWTPSELSPAHPRYTHGAIDWDALYRPDGERWQSVEEGLTRMAEYGRSRRVTLVLALFPLLLRGDEPAPLVQQMNRIYEQVQQAATSRGFVFVDVRHVFAAVPGAELRFQPEDPIHPGARGHTLAADAIVDALDQHRLLPVPAAP